MINYRNELLAIKNMPGLSSYLMEKSGLPGPRGNLGLAAAAAEILDESTLLSLIGDYPPEVAPVNHPGEFAAFCGTCGLGRLVTEGKSGYLNLIRTQASDPRWRLREAAAMALQTIGRWQMGYLLQAVKPWVEDDWLVRRAVAAGLAEPCLLKERAEIVQVFDLFDQLTAAIEGAGQLKDSGFITLRQALGYGWSVVVSALPDKGKLRMERWMNSSNRHTRWIMKENLKKKRLLKMDEGWVKRWEATF